MQEGRNKATGCSIHVDWNVQTCFGLKLIQLLADFFDGFVNAGEGHAQCGDDTDCVFVHVVFQLLRPHVEGALAEWDLAQFHIKVLCELMPTHLNRTTHHIGFVVGFAFLLAAVSPCPFQGQTAQHGGF